MGARRVAVGHRHGWGWFGKNTYLARGRFAGFGARLVNLGENLLTMDQNGGFCPFGTRLTARLSA
eukprot:scaffold58163_cov39-Cyclotella_meneghiniana.AAC.6